MPVQIESKSTHTKRLPWFNVKDRSVQAQWIIIQEYKNGRYVYRSNCRSKLLGMAQHTIRSKNSSTQVSSPASPPSTLAVQESNRFLKGWQWWDSAHSIVYAIIQGYKSRVLYDSRLYQWQDIRFLLVVSSNECAHKSLARYNKDMHKPSSMMGFGSSTPAFSSIVVDDGQVSVR